MRLYNAACIAEAQKLRQEGRRELPVQSYRPCMCTCHSPAPPPPDSHRPLSGSPFIRARPKASGPRASGCPGPQSRDSSVGSAELQGLLGFRGTQQHLFVRPFMSSPNGRVLRVPSLQPGGGGEKNAMRDRAAGENRTANHLLVNEKSHPQHPTWRRKWV